MPGRRPLPPCSNDGHVVPWPSWCPHFVAFSFFVGSGCFQRVVSFTHPHWRDDSNSTSQPTNQSAANWIGCSVIRDIEVRFHRKDARPHLCAFDRRKRARLPQKMTGPNISLKDRLEAVLSLQNAVSIHHNFCFLSFAGFATDSKRNRNVKISSKLAISTSEN